MFKAIATEYPSNLRKGHLLMGNLKLAAKLKTRLYVKQFIRRLGFDVQRLPKGATNQPQFYEVPMSCQVPNLAFMLEFFLGRRTDGEFVEVGAYDGYLASNTWGLARAGWKGLYIEPVPEHADMCRKNHAKHRNVEVVNVAVGSDDGETDIMVAGPLSTIDSAQAAEAVDIGLLTQRELSNRIRVPIRRLDALLSEHGANQGFDLLVVDVEGAEEQVFEGFDVAEWQPAMLIVELTDLRPDKAYARAAAARVGNSILSCGYTTVFKDAGNTVFVRNDRLHVAYGEEI